MADWDDKLSSEQRGFDFFWSGLKIFWHLLGEEKKSLVLVTAILIVVKTMESAVAYCLKMIFDAVPEVVKTHQISSMVVWLLVVALIIKLISLFIHHFIQELTFVRSAIRLENGWPVRAQEKLLSLSLGFHERENIGKKIAKINKGCNRLMEVLTLIYWDIFPDLFFMVINFIFIFIMDYRLGLVFMIPFIVGAKIENMIFQKFYDLWEQWDSYCEESNGYFHQSLTNVRTVQGFVQEQQEQQRFTAIRQKMTNLDYDIHRRMQRYFFWLNLCLQISYLVTIGLGLYFVFNGTGKAGTVVFVFATGSVMIHNLDAVFHNYFKVMRNMVSVLRMNDLLREVPEIANKKSGQILPEVKGDLAFEQVDFIYRGKETPVLKDFSVAMPSNKMIALVARSGEGKTTAIRLLTRAFEVNAGRIAIDGVDIRDVDLYWYRRLFAMVQQDVEIFDATLRANIAYAYPLAADDQIIEALTAASLEGVLTDQQRFPDGVLTEVGERGIRLSGGERQRVGIARAYLALLNGARFLILDEATSNLDSEAELAIQKMLDQVRGRLNISILAIAHRLSTIRKADIIYVMGNGTVIESGSHEKLLSGNGLYSRLVEMQNLGSLRE